MYKVEFSAADVQWQIMVLREFPDIANRHFYPAMQRATATIKNVVEPKIPKKTGLALSEFRKAVSGKGMNITGKIGWPYGVKAWYVNVLEYGAAPHRIGFVPELGVRIVRHPGLKALKFMERGQAEAQSMTDPEMARAAEGVVNELARHS